MSNSEKYSLSINFNMLTILFIGLKLTKHIDWSWWWVLAPTWIPFALFVFFTIILAIISSGRRY